jgi:RND family efflux transporter MFP subunit
MKSRRWKSMVVVLGLGVSLVFLSWLRVATATGAQRAAAPPLPISVRAAKASRGVVQSWVFAEGTARSVRREYLVFQNAGRVTFVKDGADGEDLREGALVQAGELLAHQDQRSLLAEIESADATVAETKTQVAVAEAEQTRAHAEHQLAIKTLERFAVLLAQDSASKQEHDEAQTSTALAAAAVAQASSRLAAAHAKVTTAEARHKQAILSLEETELRSPIDGVVAYLNIKEGYHFTPSLIRTDSESAALQTVPMVILDPSAFEVTVNVPAYSREGVRPGQEALVIVRSDAIARLAAGNVPTDDEDFVRGTVFAVNPAVSPGGRAIQVKVRVTERVSLLKDGLFVSVWLAAEKRADVVLVPSQSLVYEDNRPHVFVVENGIARRRSVTLGLQEFTTQEITDGLQEGELVVTDGRFQVSQGAAVRLLGEQGAK